MKLRLLNGSHQAMAYFGYLAGYRLVHEAAQDPLFRAFMLAPTLASLHRRGARTTLESLA
jgi:mannitol-1-phosphate/altronate dehydrogenase